MKNYIKPEVEVISFFSNEAITDEIIGGETGSGDGSETIID